MLGAWLLCWPLLKLPLVQSSDACVCNFHSTVICCGQSLDQGRDHCVDGGGRQCPADTPTCTDYVYLPRAVWVAYATPSLSVSWCCTYNGWSRYQQHMGTCKGSEGDECEAGMIGSELQCPLYTTFPGGCIVKKDKAEEACRVTPGCEYIGVCNNKPWNDQYPDSVQLYTGPLKPNTAWESCKRVPLSPPSAAGMALLMVLASGSMAYTIGGVAVGRRTGGGGWSLKTHPHHQRWSEMHGLVVDGCNFLQGRRREGAGAASTALLQDRPASTVKTRASGEGSGGTVSRASLKKKERKGKQKRASDDAPSVVATAAPQPGKPSAISAPVAAAMQPSTAGKATTAGDGGRWVHVPN